MMNNTTEVIPMPNEKIVIEKITKTYVTATGENLPVLRGIDLDIYDKEFISIIGPSGCGKTTLLLIISGLIPKQGGRVLLDGVEVTAPGRDRGVVFQQDAIFLWRKVIENVEYGLEIGGMDRKERRERGRKFLRLVGLEKFEKYYPKELSGGMKKKVALAMVFANDPEVYLMDEPFGSLDYPTKVGLQKELLRIWREEQKTTIFITHDLEEALFLSDRICVLTQGKVEEILEVPFPRPREDNIRTSGEFQSMKAKLWKYLV
jgi:NitT/TauT family transport system ATP-binding protein